MKKILTIAIIVLIYSQSFAQLSVGGQTSFISLLGTPKVSSPGFGIRADYAQNEKFVYSLGFSHYLSQDLSDPEGTISSFNCLYLNGRTYFVGDYEDTFNVYVLGEIGSIGLTFEDKNSSIGHSNLTVGLGLGGEKDLNFGYVYSEIKISISANGFNSREESYDVPTSLIFNVGVRIPFDL